MPAPDRALAAELTALFLQGVDAPLADEAFNELALRVFLSCFTAVPPYAAYCRARGRAPGDVEHWTEIPAVPTAAFKALRLAAPGVAAEAVFRTSGTTRGPELRGEHHVPDLGLYRASLRATFEAFLLPDGVRPRILSLMPPRDVLPDSSLAFMITDVLETFGGPGSAAYADAAGVEFDALEAALDGEGGPAPSREEGGAVQDAGVKGGTGEGPVLLLGTTSAYIHWLDRLAQGGRRLDLPEGSRLMDTGGYKGAGRRVSPVEMRRAYRDRLALPAHACVNEYGMTELLSQYYDRSLRDAVLGSGESGGRLDEAIRKRGPPWLRSVAVSPETLAPLPPGETGLLRHVDLANAGSVLAVQTEDLGRVDESGIVLEGRVPGATPRGCSLAMDLLLGGGG